MPVEVKYPNFRRAGEWAKREFGDYFLDVSNYCTFSLVPGAEPELIFYFEDMQWLEVHIFVRNLFFGHGQGQPNSPYRIPDPPPLTFEGLLNLRTDHPEGWIEALKREPYYPAMKKAYDGFAARLIGRQTTESIRDLIKTDLSAIKMG